LGQRLATRIAALKVLYARAIRTASPLLLELHIKTISGLQNRGNDWDNVLSLKLQILHPNFAA